MVAQKIRIERVLALPRESLRIPGTIYLVRDSDNDALLEMHVVGNTRSSVSRVPTIGDISQIVQSVVEALNLQDGQPGASAYEIAVANGFVGTEAQWLLSLREQAYEHVQSSPVDEWIVNHNLARNPVIEIMDVAGREIEADVLHVSPNQTRIYFNQPKSGKAIAR